MRKIIAKLLIYSTASSRSRGLALHRTDDLPITSRTDVFQRDPPRTILAAQLRDPFHPEPSGTVWYQRLGCHKVASSLHWR